jgi:vitamin B12 transporter
VHAFPRGWESQATNATEKLTIPSQVTYGLALSYVLYGPKLRLGTTLEAQNLTDAKLFDFYGVQRPGRAFFAKWTLDY